MLVTGVGRSPKQLISFEMALREAGISGYNLVAVSSILPADAEISTDKSLLKSIPDGSVVFYVVSRISSDENNRMLSSAVGVAISPNPEQHGYLSEHHGYGMTKEDCGIEAEEIAMEMLSTIREETGAMVTRHISEQAVVKNGEWTTVVSAAVLR